MHRLAAAVRAGAVLVGLLAALAPSGPAGASVLSDSPTLPVLGMPYLPAAGAGCFAAAGVCITAGSLTLTSLLSSSLDAAGQTIVTTAAYSGLLTTLAAVPIALVQLLGTVEQLVQGRGSATELGRWTTGLVAMSLNGTVLGRNLTLGLDPAQASTGVTSVAPLPGSDGTYVIDSFFDVFFMLTLEGSPPLSTTVGPIRGELTAVPEPAVLALLLGSCLMLAAVARRRG